MDATRKCALAMLEHPTYVIACPLPMVMILDVAAANQRWIVSILR
jgi:hypothetical protein